MVTACYVQNPTMERIKVTETNLHMFPSGDKKKILKNVSSCARSVVKLSLCNGLEIVQS